MDLAKQKDIVWMGSSLVDLRGFPEPARKAIGINLRAVQSGKEPFDWKPMPSVGWGVREIRVHDSNEYRVIYITKFKDAVYVLHCFVKKTRKTPLKDIQLARQRLKEVFRNYQ